MTRDYIYLYIVKLISYTVKIMRFMNNIIVRLYNTVFNKLMLCYNNIIESKKILYIVWSRKAILTAVYSYYYTVKIIQI